MDLETPRMVYRAGGPTLLESGAYTCRVVADAPELKQALADGWHLDQYAAKDAAQAPAAPETEPEAQQQPTRAELEQKAGEMGLKFDGRTSDKKLGAMIADALKA